ncbi:MAG: iron-sulfur cluster assembly scaffold protein [Granulosicoccaceae bacterium]
MAHSTQVLQRFLQPRYVQMQEPLAVGGAGSRLAGAQVEIHLGVVHGILQARFRAYGCPATIASADWLAEQLDGLAIDAPRPDRHSIMRALDLGPARQHCAALAVEAMDAAFTALKTNT